MADEREFKIGIFGSAVDGSPEVARKAQELGTELAKRNNIIIVTGASNGLPYEVAYAAHQAGAKVWQCSPCVDETSQISDTPNADLSIYERMIFVPREYEHANTIEIARKYRNITSTAMVDAGIIISGRWGTMNEFTCLYDFGKVIGVLNATGGIADWIYSLSRDISKPSAARIIINSSPEILVEAVLEELRRRQLS